MASVAIAAAFLALAAVAARHRRGRRRPGRSVAAPAPRAGRGSLDRHRRRDAVLRGGACGRASGTCAGAGGRGHPHRRRGPAGQRSRPRPVIGMGGGRRRARVPGRRRHACRRHAPGGPCRAHGPPPDRQPRLPRGAREPRRRRVAGHARRDRRRAGARAVGSAAARARVGQPRWLRVGGDGGDAAPLPANRVRDADRAAPGDDDRRARARPRCPAGRGVARPRVAGRRCGRSRRGARRRDRAWVRGRGNGPGPWPMDDGSGLAPRRAGRPHRGRGVVRHRHHPRDRAPCRVLDRRRTRRLVDAARRRAARHRLGRPGADRVVDAPAAVDRPG